MKQLISITCILLSMTSCKIANMPLGGDPDTSKKYVKTETGREIAVSRVEAQKKTLVTDSGTFKRADVKSYCDGRHVYFKRTTGTWLTQIYTGKLNIYTLDQRVTTTSFSRGSSQSGAMTTSTGTRTSWFMQPQGSTNAIDINSRNLWRTIPRDDAAFAYMQSFRRKRRINRLIKLSAAGLFFGSLASVDGTPDLAIGMFLSSFPVLTIGFIRSLSNHDDIKAVAAYNGIDVNKY